MISSIKDNNISEKQNTKDFYALSFRCYRVWANNHIDLHSLIDQITTLFSQNKNHRSEFYSILSNILLIERLENINDGHLVKRVNSLFDRFPSLFESATTDDELSRFVKFASSLLEFEHDSITQGITRTIPKFVSTICRLSKSQLYESYCLQLLENILLSDYKQLLYNNHSMIKDICIEKLDNSIAREKAASILSLIHSTESAETWSSCFSNYCFQLLFILHELGINIHIENDTNMQKFLNKWKEMQHSSGFSKVLVLERSFDGYIAVLRSMLTNGCSTGTTPLDFRIIINVFNAISARRTSSNFHDPKASIENEFGVSENAYSLISFSLINSCLLLVKEILLLYHPSLVKFSDSLCHGLAAILSREDVHNNPLNSDTYFIILDCYQILFQLFPMKFVKNLNLGISVIIDHFNKAMTKLVSSNSDYDLGNKTKIDFSDLILQRYLRLFQCVENILLFEGPLLIPSTRESIEVIIAKGLKCLCLGCINSPLPDRKIRRTKAEILRQIPQLQNALISLAVVEIQSPCKSGVIGGNIRLLKMVASICCRNVLTSVIAAKALQSIDMILHPCNIVLPSIPNIIQVKSFVSKIEENERMIDSMNQNNNILTQHLNIDANMDTDMNSNEPMEIREDDSINLKDSRKRPFSQAMEREQVTTTQPVEVSFEVKAPYVSVFSETNHVSNIKTKKMNDDEDDDSIPDIVIEEDGE